MPRTTGLDPNLAAALDTIGVSELTAALLAVPSTDNGYLCLVGSTVAKPLLFSSYASHPGILNHQFNSTAAGRYQIIRPTFRSLCMQMNVTDFSPETQDRMCLELIRQHRAIDLFVAGRLQEALAACATEWASLPASTAGQHLQKYSDLEAAFIKAGGKLGT